MTIEPYRRRIYGFLLVLVGCLSFAVRGYHDEQSTLQSFDFKPVYASTLCLMQGCDPYDSAQIEQVYLQHGGDPKDLRPFRPYNANYPPSALFLTIPLALLPFPLAQAVWLILGMLLFSIAALCTADLCTLAPCASTLWTWDLTPADSSIADLSPAAPSLAGPSAGWPVLVAEAILAAFVASSTILVMLGQPAMYSISLVVLAVWSFLRRRSLALGVLAFAVSLTLKPHVGALVWLFFLLSSSPSTRVPPTMGAALASPLQPAASTVSRRRLALYTLAATLLLMTPGVLLAYHHPASSHWPQELRHNLVEIASPGQASNPGPTNDEVGSIASLQALFALWHRSPRFYNLATYATFLPLFLAWLYLLLRRSGQAVSRRTQTCGALSAADLMALAAAAALSFLPIYHRQYDTRLLLLVFPAVAWLASRYRRLGGAALALSALATLTLSHQFVHLAVGHGARLVPGRTALHGVPWLVFHRPLPLTLLLLSCFFLYAMSFVSQPFVSQPRVSQPDATPE
ncbi:MAG: glycosyltransferase family 87 protein [Acidobacteriaceae bacterium]